MPRLTKTALIITGLALVILCLTSATQAFVSSGKNSLGVYWHVPLYGTVRMPESSWWIFVRVWLLSLVLPTVLWITVGLRKLISKTRGRPFL
jgi:hypothetical protein